MFHEDPNQAPVGRSHSILPPHFIGGPRPSRHDGELAACLEKQAEQRAAVAARQPSLWGILLQAARRAAAAAWQPQHGRFEINHPRSALK